MGDHLAREMQQAKIKQYMESKIKIVAPLIDAIKKEYDIETTAMIQAIGKPIWIVQLAHDPMLNPAKFMLCDPQPPPPTMWQSIKGRIGLWKKPPISMPYLNSSAVEEHRAKARQAIETILAANNLVYDPKITLDGAAIIFNVLDTNVASAEMDKMVLATKPGLIIPK
jgi:hypothetical protein